MATTAARYPVWSWAGAHRLREADIGVEPHRILVEMREMFDNARYWHDHATFSPADLTRRRNPADDPVDVTS